MIVETRRRKRKVVNSRRLWEVFLLHRASMGDVDAMEAAKRSVELFDSHLALDAQDGNRAPDHEPRPLEG